MHASGWPIWGLTKTVFGSILEVGLLCVAGYILARQGILDKRTQKHVNRLNVSLFTPSLLFSKVAFSLTPAKLKELWIIPIVFVVTTVCSMTVSYAFGSVIRLKKSQRSFAMAASMFMNSNSLPIALMQSMVSSVKELRWDDDDDEDAMLGRALTYLVLYSTLGMMLRWSYGVHLLSQADEEVPTPPSSPDEVPQQPTETTPLIQSKSTHTQLYASDQTTEPPALVFTESRDSSSSSLGPSSPNQPCAPNSLCPDLRHGAHTLPPPPKEAHPAPKFMSSFPNTPVYPRSEASSETEMTDDEENTGLPSARGARPRHRRVWRRLRVFSTKINAFMTVPMWAALASLTVACIRPLQHSLEEHMQPIKSALNAAGNCSIPLTLVVLGAYFYTPKSEEEAKAARALKNRRSDQTLVQNVRRMFDIRARKRGENETWESQTGVTPGSEDGTKRPGETKTVVVAVLSRMVLTPLVLLPLLTILIASDANVVFDDPVFALANVLLITSAPALTLAQITQAASGDAFERLISRTIFWAYCVVTPISTIVSVVIGLLLAKL